MKAVVQTQPVLTTVCGIPAWFSYTSEQFAFWGPAHTGTGTHVRARVHPCAHDTVGRPSAARAPHPIRDGQTRFVFRP